MAETKRTAADWERIEIAYRAGVLTLREIAAQVGGVTEGAIRKRAKRDGWTRDLKAKIDAKADELVRKATVRRTGTQESSVPPATEREVVEGVAAQQAGVRIKHQKLAARAHVLTETLIEELEGHTSRLPELEKLGEIMRNENENGTDRLNDLYRAVISLPERAKTLKTLTDAAKNAIGLEREAHGIQAAPTQVDVTATVDGTRKLRDLTDDELFAIAAGGGTRAADPPPSTD
jgi:hypothetical protein